LAAPAGLCSYRVRGVDGSRTDHLTVKSYVFWGGLCEGANVGSSDDFDVNWRARLISEEQASLSVCTLASHSPHPESSCGLDQVA